MMKKICSLVLCFCILSLAACGSASMTETTVAADDPVSLTVQNTETDARAEVLSANEAYGSVSDTVCIPVTDRSALFRTADSFRLQPIAVRAAREMIMQDIAQSDSLEISNVNVWNCADDGKSVYYSFYFNCSIAVGSGERVRHACFYDIGVRKADEVSFDAADVMEQVLEAYSVYRLQAECDFAFTSETVDLDAFVSAAKQIASSRMKPADSGKVLDVKQRPEESDGAIYVFDVLCEGENDFGMRIPDVYTVYLRIENDRVVEFDPTE